MQQTPLLKPQADSTDPSDKAIFSAAPPPVKKTSTPKPPSRMAKLRKIMMASTLALVAGTSLLGGIAYHANKDALHQPTIQLYTQPELATPAPSRAPTTLDSIQESEKLAHKAVTSRTNHTAQPPAVTVYVPADTVKGFVDDFQNTPTAKAMITEKTELARKTVEQAMSQLKLPDGVILVDAHAPLPTSEHSFLRIGGTDLPSFGLRGLKTETVPMAIEYSTDALHPHLNIQVEPIKVSQDQSIRPDGLKTGGIFLGAMRVKVGAAEGQVSVNGSVGIKLDLDGKATQAKLDLLKKGASTPEKQSLIKQMETRLAAGQRLKALGAEQGFDSLLQGGFGDQKVDFSAVVDTGKGSLSDSTFYLWAAPGSSPDGKPQILVAQQTSLDGMKNLQVKLTHLESKGSQPDGMMARMLHSKIQSGLVDSIQQ